MNKAQVVESFSFIVPSPSMQIKLCFLLRGDLSKVITTSVQALEEPSFSILPISPGTKPISLLPGEVA